MFDLKCLDKYKGREIVLRERLHYFYVTTPRSSILERRGILLNSGEGFTTFFDYKRGSNNDLNKSLKVIKSDIERRVLNSELGIEQEPFYRGDIALHLGPTKTLWHILDLETQKSLFKHKQIGIDEYLVIGPNSEVLGIVKGNLRDYGKGFAPFFSKKGMNTFSSVQDWNSYPLSSIPR